MLLFMYEQFGNPSSPYSFGRDAKAGLELARNQVAASIGAKAEEITFTYGGTESSNIAIKGVVEAVRLAAAQGGGAAELPHVVTSSIEHPCVVKPLEWLVDRGMATTTVVPVDGEGRVDASTVAAAITASTCLVTIMQANNEVGFLRRGSALASGREAR